MPRKPAFLQNEEPPDKWVPTQAVDDPILSSPYEEPNCHWSYIRGVPQIEQERRPASYWFKTVRTGTQQAELFAEESRDELPLVNRLRRDVKRWRESEYRGSTSVTRELLSWWKRDDAPRRLFFCQREAVETLIYLLEIVLPGRLASLRYKPEVGQGDFELLLKGERPKFEELPKESDFFPRLVDPPQDAKLLPLRRLGCKMATGSGKTVVMAKIITWAFANRGRSASSQHHPHAVLVCAPNLTVKERLQVLRPDDEHNYYDQFDLVPPKYRELLNSGRVLVTNWHGFAPKSEHDEGGTSYRVVDKGEETADAFTVDRLGELARRLPILVLNDEGHHCWRPAPKAAAKEATKGLTAEEKKALDEEAEEARVWLAGLDRINNSGLLGPGKPGILAAVDLSATPFYLANSGYPEGSPFPWLVSDFGLVDAIESGIVKIPRLPVFDDQAKKDEVGRPDPKYFRLWRHVNANLKASDKSGNKRPKPEAVYREAESALTTIASQWRERFKQIAESREGEAVVPPVLIVVCDNTEIAQVFYEKISGERTDEVLDDNGKKIKRTVYSANAINMPELQNADGVRRTVRIDTAMLNKLESGDGQTKDQAAQALRAIIDTVGRRGQPGEHIRCVVSVGMLTEGWDANNVTHVLGVRAFGSQLLCEQVVGRGLRRMNYAPDPETGRLTPEYVDVYGIPFSLIPYKGRPTDKEVTDPVYHHIFALQEREAFEIRVPVVESYTYDITDSGLRCDVDKLQETILDQEPNEVFLAPTRGYADGPTAIPASDYVSQNRQEYYRNIRLQQILFRLTKEIIDDLERGSGTANDAKLRDLVSARHRIFPEVFAIVQKYAATKIRLKPNVDIRELAHMKYAQLVKDRIRDGILPAVARKDAPLLPVVNSYRPVVSTKDVDYHTARPVVPLEKSHLNFAAILSGWERDAIETFENLDSVECFVPNDSRIGLTIPYEYLEHEQVYVPDFVVRMRGGKFVLLEIKGRGGEIHGEDHVPAKNAAAQKWVAAVNNARRYGEWAFEICKDLSQLRTLLDKHADAGQVLPFRIVEPRPEERFKTCVPLVSLKAAAGSWSEEQLNLDGSAEWASDWITWDTTTQFEKGMFVARVQGRSMEPEIPDGSYCLFRAPRAGTRQGKRLLVWHSGVSDPHTGGQYTLKVYTSEKTQEAHAGWQHVRITLKPLNPEYEPIVLEPQDEGDVGIIAEFVEVINEARH
jgi:type III restriction enzyme